MWENLEAGSVERFIRIFSVNFLSFVRGCTSVRYAGLLKPVLQILLLLSFAIIYYAQTKKQEFADALPNLAACNTELPGLAYGSAYSGDVEYVRHRDLEAQCGSGLAYITINSRMPENVTATPCVAPCVGPSSTSKCSVNNVEFTHSTLAACYCKQQLQKAIVGTYAEHLPLACMLTRFSILQTMASSVGRSECPVRRDSYA